MKLIIQSPQQLERLKFLIRVVNKELRHLKYSANKLFATPFTVEKARSLQKDEGLAEQVEAFTSRFCRLQDTVGDKLLPAWLNALGEEARFAVENLDKAEKIGVLSSADQWVKLRQLRNQMIHEYIEDMAILADALQTAYEQHDFLVDVAQAIVQDLRDRGVDANLS